MRVWLIQTLLDNNETLYFCEGGQWCNNVHHAKKFYSRLSAEYRAHHLRQPTCVIEHDDPLLSTMPPR